MSKFEKRNAVAVDLERRIISDGFEVRVIQSADGKTKKIVGYAAKYNVRSKVLYGSFREVIKPGAFTKSLVENPDLRFLVNHNPESLLGRVKSGTLAVVADEIGLRFELTPPDTQFGRDTVAMVERGDLNEMSFGFRTRSDSWGTDENGFDLRTLEEISVDEISLATWAAYDQTEASVRSHEQFKKTKVVGKSVRMAEAELRLARAC